ncbi:MAG: gluconokinase, GntK/IdnK-type [Acidobacteriota bacterium]|nr:gluconokinase, GntK/IdnK-type [Acidobacteriota bacterium]
MGVSGAGKTLVGRTLAESLEWTFLDADDFHPQANIAKMAAGTPLDPQDRAAWLEALLVALAAASSTGHAVLACSALRANFRSALAAGVRDVRFVYLRADRDLIRARVAGRLDHFMPVSLVDSQFDTLEEPGDALTMDGSKTPEEIVRDITRQL